MSICSLNGTHFLLSKLSSILNFTCDWLSVNTGLSRTLCHWVSGSWYFIGLWCIYVYGSSSPLQNPLKQWESFTWWHSITPQKTSGISNLPKMAFFWIFLSSLKLEIIKCKLASTLCNISAKSMARLRHGGTNFPGATSNSRHQKGDMKQIPYWGPTNIRRHHIKFSHPGDLVPGISAPLVYGLHGEVHLWPYPNLVVVFVNQCDWKW